MSLQTPLEIFLLIVGLAVFSFVAWRRLDWAAALILFCSPLYLLKIKVGWLPLTVLELLIWVFFGVWLIKKFFIIRHAGPDPGSRVFCFRRDGVWIPAPRSSSRISSAGMTKKSHFLPALLILIGVALATVFSADLRTSAGIFKTWFLAPMVFSWVLLDVVKTKEQLKAILWAAVLSAAAVAVISLGYLLSGQLTFNGRLKAFYLSPNHLAMYLAPGFLLALGLWFETKKVWQKFLLIIYHLSLIAVLYYTYSYAAWLAVLAGLAVFGTGLVFFSSAPFRLKSLITNRLSLLTILGFLVLLAVLFWSQLGAEKLTNLIYSDRSSWQSRLVVWQASYEILERHWFLGIGPGLFQQHYLAHQKYSPPYLEWAVPQPHNLFLAFWLQAGLLGLAGFVWLMIGFFRTHCSAWRQTKSPLVLALAAAMLYILAHGLVDTPYWKNDLSLIFWVIVALNYKASRLCDW